MKKIFIIQPVRNISEKQRNKIELYVSELEAKGHKVYLPHRDTNQIDDIGFRICCDNNKGMLASDEVHIFYDNTSKGSLFDLGMAFALNKKLFIINEKDLEQTKTKSIDNMINFWAKKGEQR